LYLGKNALLLSIGSMYWLNIGALIVLSFAHVLTTKKEISWELVGFLVVSALFLFVAKLGAQNTKVPSSGKQSVRR
jgi:membrane protein implicated in regulation of membrane protease activity